MASYLKIINDSGFSASFSGQWEGGETDRTMVVGGEVGAAAYIDLTKYSIPLGTSCWVRAYVQEGPNHDSGDNFTYNANGMTAVYRITGSTLNPSFNYLGEQNLGAPHAKALTVTKGPARGIRARQESTTEVPADGPRGRSMVTVTVEYS